MKLALTHERGLELLTASGAIEPRDVLVLKAGVGKLIRDGKNQIILEVAEPNLPDELIRELMTLDLVARELSGRLVVMASRPELRTKIENFARPMTLGVFADRLGAFEFFEKMNAAPLGPIAGSEASVAPSSGAAVPSGENAPAAAPPEADAAAAAQDQIQKLKQEIRDRELKELGQLRETISRLENENRALMEQFKTYFIDRRSPADERAYQQRIAELEENLEKLMNEMGQEKAK